MNRQKGQITLYAALAVGVLVVGLTIAVKVQSSRLATCRAEFALFEAQVKANGEAAERAKVAKEAADKAEKVKNDQTYSKLSASNAALARQLRDNRAAGGILPRATATTDSPSGLCFDRPLLESALQRLDDGVSRLVGEGDQATLRLKLSHDWALQTLKP